MSARNRIALITGSTDGIGKEAASMLAFKGYRVIIHGRNNGKVRKVVKELRELTKNPNVDGVIADFNHLKSVDRMSEEIIDRYENIDVLINNAGIFEYERRLTADGLESTFQVNYLSHFLLTNRLLKAMKKETRSWIINVSSMVHASYFDRHNIQKEKNYDGYEAYSESKLYNVLFTYKLFRILGKENNIHVYAVHPGVINTKLLAKGWTLVGASPHTGATNILAPIFNDKLSKLTGIYVMNGRKAKSTSISFKEEVQDFLWEYSLEILKKLGFNM